MPSHPTLQQSLMARLDRLRRSRRFGLGFEMPEGTFRYRSGAASQSVTPEGARVKLQTSFGKALLGRPRHAELCCHSARGRNTRAGLAAERIHRSFLQRDDSPRAAQVSSAQNRSPASLLR
jgi:hypothetical protein